MKSYAEDVYFDPREQVLADHARTATHPLVGRLVADRYRVDALIGVGGMCSVFRAEHLVLSRMVAIKVLPADKASTPELARRFRREAAAANRISHPNVVSIYESGTLEDGSLFLVMELLEGRSLAALLRIGRLGVPRALSIARQILIGLGESHKEGIVHRDVKPENVFLVDEGGSETVKLFDFGIASNDRAAEKLTAAGVAFGTPEYISPEMAMGVAVDERADLYAVGVILFEMVTGRLPFERADRKALLQAHIHEPPPSPCELAPDADIPPGLDAIILRALAKLPEERFADTAEMVRALDAGMPRPPRRRARRSRGRQLAVGGALLVAFFGGAAWLYQSGALLGPLGFAQALLAGDKQDLVNTIEHAGTCDSRRAALAQIVRRHDRALLPSLRRAAAQRDPCLGDALSAAIRELEGAAGGAAGGTGGAAPAPEKSARPSRGH